MILFAILIALALLYFLIAYIIFYCACGKQELKMLSVNIEKMLEPYKDLHAEGLKWHDKQISEDVSIISFDGLKLHAEVIEKSNAIGTIILMHGYKSTAEKDLYSALTMYDKLNLNIVITDERASSKSEGKYITFGVLEGKDACSWSDYAKERWNLPIMLGGISMGASAVLYASSGVNENVKLIVEDSAFICPYEQVRYCIKHYLKVNGDIFMPAVNMFAKIFAKYDMKKSVEEELEKTNLPILFIHGKKDDFVLVENTLKMYEDYKGEKDLFIEENSTHGIAYLVDKEGYEKKIKEMVEKYLK